MQQAEARSVVLTLAANFDVDLADETVERWADSLGDLEFDEALDAVDQLVAEWTAGGGRRMPTQAELRQVYRARRRVSEGTGMAGATSWSRRHVCPACKGAGWMDRTAEQAERDGKKLSAMAVTKCYVCNGTGKGNELEDPPTPREEALERIGVLRQALSGGVVKHVDEVKPPEEHVIAADGSCDHPGCAFHRRSSSASEPTSSSPA